MIQGRGLMNWQAIFFDFDGVVLDSVNVKTKAFARMFRQYGPGVEKSVVDYHLNNGGISRFEKFRYYYEHILHRPIDDQKINELAEEFSSLVLENVLNSPFIPGVLETLNQLKKENIPAYIVSGTPQDEINTIVVRKKLGRFFQKVYGSPRQKDEIIRDILETNGYGEKNCLFIGDAMTDFAAAQKTGVCFLGIVKRNEPSPFPKETFISYRVTIKLAS